MDLSQINFELLVNEFKDQDEVRSCDIEERLKAQGIKITSSGMREVREILKSFGIKVIRTLRANWSVEAVQDLKCSFNIDLSSYLTEQAWKDLTKK